MPYQQGQILRFNGEKGGTKVGQKIFATKYLYLTFLSALGGQIEVRPIFVDQEKANSIKYVTAKDTNKMDAGIEAAQAPPQKNMVNDFITCRQNFSELKMMIDESQKKGNQEFGKEIISVAVGVKNKRD